MKNSINYIAFLLLLVIVALLLDEIAVAQGVPVCRAPGCDSTVTRFMPHGFYLPGIGGY